MFCKSVKYKWFWYVMIVIGAIALIFGIVGSNIIPDEQHNLDMLMGMFFGLGSVFVIIGCIRVIYYKRASSEKLKKQEVELNDERNIQILRAANSVANVTGIILFAVMVFVFVGLDYIVPAFISIGAMFVQGLILFVSKRYIGKRM